MIFLIVIKIFYEPSYMKIAEVEKKTNLQAEVHLSTPTN